METMDFLSKNVNGMFTTIQYKNHADWLAGRANGIGASEVAAVLGKSPWMTERELWERKVHPENVKFNGNSDTERGHLSEEHIRVLFGIEMGMPVYDGTNIILRSSAHPFMTASLDGMFEEDGKPVVMEIKSIRKRNDDWMDDCIPNYYLLQCLAQLIVTGWSKAILVARFCRNKGWLTAYERTYEIHASDYEDAMDKLVRKVQNFWENNVMAKNAPGVRVPTI